MGTFSSSLRQSFQLPAPALTEKNLPNQSGKVFVVTGSNTGVGFQLAQILYGANASVYLACRTKSKAESAMTSIKSAHPDSKGALHYLHLDLSNLNSIKLSAEAFLAKESRLDVLWNNAGVMVPPPQSDGTQGHDLQYVTNILGPFLFTKLLLPVLKKTAQGKPRSEVRVAWASSLAMDLNSPVGGAEFEDGDGTLEVYKINHAMKRYGVTKAANFFLGYEFGKRYGDHDGVLHISFNPGNLASDLQRHARETFGSLGMKVIELIMFPAIFGAYTELYAGLSPDLTTEQHQGAYIWPWGRKGSVRGDIHAQCKVGGKSEKIYEWCEKETAKFG